ncbi:acyltransferase family protein [Phytohabitans rumicis]|uniref:Acyltransferase 3 domain-containing protein n=1 Tax=Phytohabitans rumicis TaxID=1076125 RepID=A0A6V8KPM8_9ACTN|nr:acyltransferase [Phytohabitans rumicis]GFJ87133.1 hypothetical protein Prum_007750 [Phytohabitans rumicis]
MTDLAQRHRAATTIVDGNRSAAVYGIRGMAALALLTVHVAMFSGLLGTRALGDTRPPSNALGAFLVSGLPSFIGVFFVLPALYLYLPLAKSVIAGTRRPAQGRGLVRRLLRLLPAYYLMLAVVLLAFHRGVVDGVWYVLRPVLLLQVYAPSPFVPKLLTGLEVTWTVPTMVQWYLALPLIAWASHRYAIRGATPAIRARRLMLPVPLLIGMGLAWLFFVKANGWDNRIVFWWPQGFAPSIGVGMALAVMIALAQVSPVDTPRFLRAAAGKANLFYLGALVVYLVNCARPFSVIGMDAIYSVSGLLVTYLMVTAFGLLTVPPLVAPGARGSRLLDAVLTNRPVVHLGRVSYGIYLWHFAIMHFVLQPGSVRTGAARPIRELYGTSGFWKLEALTVAGAVLAATVSYYLLERPVAAWGDRLLSRRRPDRPPAVGTGPPDRLAVIGSAPDPAADPATDPTAAAVARAVADRDAIRANLLDLERAMGRELLATASLTGDTRQRWDAATVDLTALWDVFTAYSDVVDRAAAALRDSRPQAATSLLDGPSVRLTGAPAPLDRRHITDDGQVRLTPAAAVARMNELFARTAELVVTVEAMWRDGS